MADPKPGREGPQKRLDARFANKGESDTIRRPEGPSRAPRETGFAAVIRQAAPYMAATWTLTAALLLGVFGGRWLDTRLGSEPWLMLAGSLLGLAVGMYQLARVALRRPAGGTNGGNGRDGEDGE